MKIPFTKLSIIFITEYQTRISPLTGIPNILYPLAILILERFVQHVVFFNNNIPAIDHENNRKDRNIIWIKLSSVRTDAAGSF